MTTIEKMEKGIITLAEFTEEQQSFIRGIVKLSFNEGQEQALRIHDVVGRSEQLKCQCKTVKFTRTVDADFNPLCGRCGKAL
jgi:hypothetical protein